MNYHECLMQTVYMQYYDNFKRTTLKEGPPKLTRYFALLWKPLVGDLHTCK